MPPGTPGGPTGTPGGPEGRPEHHFDPLWDISTPHWTFQVPHVCPGGVLPPMRKGVYRMAWSPNPTEASPLVLRSVTVLLRALLEVSPDPCGATTTTTNNNNNNKQQTTAQRASSTPCIHRPQGGSLIRCGDPLTLMKKRN